MLVNLFGTFRFHRMIGLLVAFSALGLSVNGYAQSKAGENTEPDVLVLSNGDTLHGKFVNEINGKVTFHTDAFGNVTLGWDKIKELHTHQKFAVLNSQEKAPSNKAARQMPT